MQSYLLPVSFKRCIIIISFILSLIPVYANADLTNLSPQEYINQNPSEERKAIVNFITGQFENWNGIEASQVALDAFWNDEEARRTFCAQRFQIINQKLYADKGHGLFFSDMVTFLQGLLSKYKIDDVDFIVYVRDEIQSAGGMEQKVLHLPSFMFSKNLASQYEKDKFLMPDAFLIQEYWRLLVGKIKKANETSIWKDKVEKIFWRGATAGPALDHEGVHALRYNIDNISDFPRLDLVMLSSLYPDLIDAKFHKYLVISRDIKGLELMIMLAMLGSKGENVPEVDHLAYKYLISIDGSTAAWKRVPWIMLSNSVLIKQETSSTQWFYPAMKHYVHYVPVNERLTDIFPKLEWLKSHDREAERISIQAQKLVSENLMPADIEKHMVLILNAYHKLHKGARLIPTLPAVE